ncbi:MAG: hypothetical protein QME51_07490 [Planctomycetota bacterium]|nr:hypothetical protein [Planctomycetota bacterium]
MNKIIFEIASTIKNGKTAYVVKLQITDIISTQTPDIVRKVEYLENLYKQTIGFCLSKLGEISKIKNNNKLLLYWETANRIRQFLKLSEDKGFYLNNYYKHFCRDLKISRETLKRLMRLIKAVRNKADLDTSKSWSYYTRRYCRLKTTQ